VAGVLLVSVVASLLIKPTQRDEAAK
jgi:hypothetical protein